MKKLNPKYVYKVLKDNNLTMEKRVFEKFVKDLNMEADPTSKLFEFLKSKGKIK